MKLLSLVAGGAALMAVFALGIASRPAPAQAQLPSLHRSKTLPPTVLAGLQKQLGAAVAPQAPRQKVYQLVIEEFTWWDFVGDEDITTLDPVVAYGTLYLNQQPVGEWRLSGQGLNDVGAVTGHLQMDMSTGSVSVDFGFANPGGVRSGTPCRPIIGGTGKHATLKGNASIVARNYGFDVVLGAK